MMTADKRVRFQKAIGKLIPQDKAVRLGLRNNACSFELVLVHSARANSTKSLLRADQLYRRSQSSHRDLRRNEDKESE